MMLYYPGKHSRSLQTGTFNVKITTNIPQLLNTIDAFYPTSSDEQLDRIYDFHIKFLKILPIRRSQIGRVVFLTDIPNPYPSFPVEHHFALFEWGFNWCIAILAQQFVMLHSAVLEKSGQALILPAFPGSGKSTLCASLVLKGWRLLSDEFGLYRPESNELIPLPRPIALKNASIDVLRGFSPEARFGPVFRGTHKGDVAHMHPPADSIAREKEPATPRWIVFPQYKQDSKTQLLEYAKGPAFLKLAGNSFNYRLQGARGFRALNMLVKNCDTHYLEFDNLDHAHEKIARLTTL